MPFEVPEGWCWCRLDEVADVARGGSPRPIKQYLTDSPDGVNWIKIGDTTEGCKYIEKTVEMIIPEGVRHSRMVKEGDFLLTNSMSFGKPFILKTNGCIHDGWLVISPFEGSFDKDYLYYLLSSEFAYEQFSDKASGAVVSNLNKDKVAESLFPLPPFEEQKKIVCQIESIMNFIGQMENNIEEVSTLIDRCKTRILNLAIHGKLVPQDDHDEPASELLKRINPKAVASCDNPQYGKVPSSWVISTVGDVFTINPKTHVDDDTEAAFVPMTCVEDGYSNTFEYECRKWGEIKKGFVHFQDDDVAVAKISPCLENRKSVVFHDLPNGIGAGTTELNVFRCKEILPEYALFYFKSQMFIGSCAGTYNGVVGQQRVAKSFIQELPIGIPPYNEQLRIVSKVNELFSQLDMIEKSLQA